MSDAAIVNLSTDDPPVLTAMSAGHATVKAGTASVDVTVWAGTPPLGTVIWSNPGNGSGVYSIVPAVPSASGVADVFAFQGDGTVQAITSEGKTAWTADVSMAYPVVPDFQGGLVGIDQSGYSGAIVKWDGMTGQRGPAYTPSGTLEYSLGVHTDGTVFAIQRSPNAVIGVDPAMGTQRFSIPVTIPGQSEGPEFSGMIVGGDGYAYVPYWYRGYPIDCSDGVGLCNTYHLRLLRVDSAGAYNDIPIVDSTVLFSELFSVPVGMISNGATGILLSWSAWNGEGPPEVGMAVTNGTGVSLINGSMAAGQASAVEPVLQAQDGSFVGTVWAGEDGDTRYMVAFDAAGSMRWSVGGNYQPQIATVDGVTIATSDSGAAVMFDVNGVAIGQMADLPTQSWLGHTYRTGSVESVILWVVNVASTYWAIHEGNQSGNKTASNSGTHSLKTVVREALAGLHWRARSRRTRSSTRWIDLNSSLPTRITGIPSIISYSRVQSVAEHGVTARSFWNTLTLGPARHSTTADSRTSNLRTPYARIRTPTTQTKISRLQSFLAMRTTASRVAKRR